jgi:hypothetical protein
LNLFEPGDLKFLEVGRLFLSWVGLLMSLCRNVAPAGVVENAISERDSCIVMVLHRVKKRSSADPQPKVGPHTTRAVKLDHPSSFFFNDSRSSAGGNRFLKGGAKKAVREQYRMRCALKVRLVEK